MALDERAEREAADRAKAVEAAVGHPGELWDALVGRVQADGIRDFTDVADSFLALMWCLDAYRAAQAPPRGMGAPGKPWDTRLSGAYRGKGNWFATLLALLLDNRTGQKLRSLGKVKGFSQNHQIDLAWPDREMEPIICVESKVTGSPAFADKPARKAMDDWTNRRKELKFASTDLKLARRKQTESIDHWDIWRRQALPKCYMVWAARLSPSDRIESMVREAAAVVATYLDGAGIVAWQTNVAGTGYELVPLPTKPSETRVLSLDDVLWQVESQITDADRRGLAIIPPEPAAPVDPDELIG